MHHRSLVRILEKEESQNKAQVVTDEFSDEALVRSSLIPFQADTTFVGIVWISGGLVVLIGT